MRNLKRALSLTLASVMLLGMMVVGSSAAAGYDDVSKDDNVEAIEVLQAIEVMVGDERGFGPERPVNRAEMAVVMGKLLSLDYNYYSTSCPFNDVYDWAQGWVGACAANGIVSGRGEGVYDPGATVTAVEAASMLMRALGYFKYQNDYADGFEVSTVRQGTIIGIFDNVGSSATEPMTRNQVAQMVLNALRSAVVEPDGNTINLTTPDGTVLTGKVNYVSVTSNKPFARAISSVQATSIGSTNDSVIVELGERLYDGKLKLNEYATDAFERPARHWEFDGKDIGTYMKKELLRQEYTQKVTGKMLYDLLTKATIEDYDFTIAVDGETTEAVLKNSAAPNSGKNAAWFTKGNLVRTNTETVGDTGDGVLTQVFVDPDEGSNGTVYIAIINTYLAKAVDDYNEKKDEATYKVWSLWDGDTTSRVGLVKNTAQTYDLDVKGEDFDIEDVKKDDIVLVHVAEGEIKEIIDPEVIDETEISSFKRTDWVNADGTQYDYSDTVQYDDDVLDDYDQTNMKDTTYRLYLDEYGYMIGIEILEDPNEYVFLTGIDLSTSNLSNKTADGFIINTDGTEATVKINMDKSKNAMGNKFSAGNNQYGTDYTETTHGANKGTGVGSLMNTWCRFTVDSNGTYTLYEVPNTNATWGATETAQKANNSKGKAAQGRNHDETGAAAELLTLDKSHIYLSSEITGFTRVYTNDDTVFITAETDRITQTNVWDGHGAKVTTGDSIIINGVDAIATGADNVNLKAWNSNKVIDEETSYSNANPAYTSNGVYTLFDKDGYVIAAVVVGEDDGTTTSFAFVTSGNMEQEAYSKDDDIYTWTRKVIINGEETILTEKTDTDPEIANIADGGNMQRGFWAEVKYDANGNVRSVTNLSTNVISPAYACPTRDFDGVYNDTITNGVWVGDKYIDSIADVEAATDEKNTVLLWDNLVNESKYVSVEGSTLQVRTATGDKDGFRIASDCKTVLIQDGEPTINNSKYMDSIQYYSGGSDGAKRAVDRLEKNHVFVGFIGAVLENGRATSIIIYDKSAYAIDQGNSNQPSVNGDYQVLTRNSANSFTVRYYDANYGTTSAMTSAQIRDFASQQVANFFGVSVKDVAWSSVSNSGTVYLDNGTLTGESVTVNTQRVLKINEGTSLVAYVDAKNYASSTLVGDVSTASAHYLSGVSAVAATASADATSYVNSDANKKIDLNGKNLTSSQDITLTIAYEVTMDNSVAASAGAVDLQTGTTYYNLVADGTTLTVSGDAAGDDTVHQLTANGTAFASKLVASTGGSPDEDVVTGTYRVTEDVVLDEVTGVIRVKINGKNLTLDGTEDEDELTTLADVRYGQKGNWLLDVTDPDNLTAIELDGSVDGGDLTDGHEYNFGYYKVTMPADITAVTNTDGALGTTAISWAVTGVTTPANDGEYYLKANDTVKATVTIDTLTAKVAGGATIVGGTGAVAKVEDATNVPAGGSAATTLVASGTTVTMNNNTDTFSGVELTFTWTVADDIAASVLTVTTNSH